MYLAPVFCIRPYINISMYLCRSSLSSNFMWVSAVVLCLVGVTTCHRSSRVRAQDDLPWYKTAHCYHGYPRSIQDSDGNGVGDLKGITQRAPYFKEIGITVVWLSPIFKSPNVDLGYDISDYRMVDPIFGTNEDLLKLLETLHNLGIKLLLDFIPNHSSDQHPWFQKSVNKEDPYTDYYVWVDGKIDPTTGQRVPPNNWVSNFSGSAWEWNEQRQQYYFHQFMVQQPDLNLRNPRVVKEMDDIIIFWLDQGFDGFRVDAVPFLLEDEQLRDNPVTDGVESDTYTQNQPGTYELDSHWADLIYNYSKKDGRERALFMESYADLNKTIAYYGTGKQSLMQPFNFMLLMYGNQSTRPKQYRDLIVSWLDRLPPGASTVWDIGNHDHIRAADHYGVGLIDAMNLLTGVLPGSKVTYYGEEIGMEDTFVRWDQTVDPAGLMRGPDSYQVQSRDPERTPMQWDDSDNAGFSTNPDTWLPVNPNYWQVNVANEEKAQTSHLKVFKAMVAAREDPILRLGDTSVMVPNEDTLVVVRSHQGDWYTLIINMGSATLTYSSENFFIPYKLNKDFTITVASINTGIKPGLKIKKGKANLRLRPQGAVLLRSQNYKNKRV